MSIDIGLSPTDLIALAALLVAVLSAIYSRGALKEAERANKISTRESLRPLRLQVFHSMHQFSHYCGTYWTLYHIREVRSSRELTTRIDTFKWEIEQHGHLEMSDVEEKCNRFVQNAWKIQRLIDRIAAGQHNPHDRGYSTAEENIEALGDWFAGENRELKSLFQPYFLSS